MKKELEKNKKEELQKELAEKRVALRDLRFGVAGSKNRNVKKTKLLKKEIARIKTAFAGQ